MQERVILAVTNDLEGDQRLYKVANSLVKAGYLPMVVGRLLPDSGQTQWPYPSKRFRMVFTRGPLFYICFNIRLFLFLLRQPADILVANDLDTLLAVFLAARIKRIRLVYDSHEYFTEVPELSHRPVTRRFWLVLENWIFPRLDRVITVNTTIAGIYHQKYKVAVEVVMNLPLAGKVNPFSVSFPDAFPVEALMVYQGAVNVGRGLEELLSAMTLLPHVSLMIIGTGDVIDNLKLLANQLGMEDRVWFTGRVPFHILPNYTRMARFGVSLEQDIGLNYRYALPNKLFDYMHSGIPVLASDLPEIRRVVEEVNFGMLIQRFDAVSLAESIREMLADESRLRMWRKNALSRAGDFTWEHQETTLLSLYTR